MTKNLTKEQWKKTVKIYRKYGMKRAEEHYIKLKAGRSFGTLSSLKNVRKLIKKKAFLIDNIGMKALNRKKGTGLSASGRPKKRDDLDIPGIIDNLTEEQKREIIEDWIKEQRNKKRKNRLSSLKSISPTVKAKILRVDRTTFYKKPKQRHFKFDYLKDIVFNILKNSFFAYGSRRIKEKLLEINIVISDRTLRTYMKRWGLSCVTRKKRRTQEIKNTQVNYKDLVKRNYNPAEDNIIATDVSYIPARVDQNFVYLSVAISHKTKLIESHVVSENNNTELVVKTLEGLKRVNFIFHSDHGYQYSSNEVQKKLKELNSVTSMGRVGNSLDNREVEYFFGCIKSEFLNHINTSKLDLIEITKLIDEYISWYNQHRIQKVLEWKTPAFASAYTS